MIYYASVTVSHIKSHLTFHSNVRWLLVVENRIPRSMGYRSIMCDLWLLINVSDFRYFCFSLTYCLLRDSCIHSSGRAAFKFNCLHIQTGLAVNAIYKVYILQPWCTLKLRESLSNTVALQPHFFVWSCDGSICSQVCTDAWKFSGETHLWQARLLKQAQLLCQVYISMEN